MTRAVARLVAAAAVLAACGVSDTNVETPLAPGAPEAPSIAVVAELDVANSTLEIGCSPGGAPLTLSGFWMNEVTSSGS